jgi:hypothetical protein
MRRDEEVGQPKKQQHKMATMPAVRAVAAAAAAAAGSSCCCSSDMGANSES